MLRFNPLLLLLIVIWYPGLTIFFSREYFGLIFNILVWQFFHGNLLGWMLLFLIPTRIQTRRLQGWISQSYVIFGHHHTPRLVRLFNILTDNVILCSNSCKYMSQKYFYHCCKVACKMRLGNNIIEQKNKWSLKWVRDWDLTTFSRKKNLVILGKREQRCFVAATISGEDAAPSVAFDWLLFVLTLPPTPPHQHILPQELKWIENLDNFIYWGHLHLFWPKVIKSMTNLKI